MTGGSAVAVFGSSRTSPGSTQWETAEAVGKKLALAGVAVITGGYGGTMEAVSKGAADEGGHVIGVTAPSLFPGRTGANHYVSELIEADDLVMRIGTMVDRADGAIALPGSIGTATELVVAWNHNYISRRNGRPMLPTAAVGDGWRVVSAALMAEVGAEPGDIHLVDTAEDAVAWVLGALNPPTSDPGL